MFLSKCAVNKHGQNLMRKLAVRNVAELVQMGMPPVGRGSFYFSEGFYSGRPSRTVDDAQDDYLIDLDPVNDQPGVTNGPAVYLGFGG